MFTPENVVNAELVVKNIPEQACFTNFVDFVKALPQYLGVEVPASVTNVVVSNIQPSSSQTTSLWIRLDNSGSFIGIYVFSGGTWRNIYPISAISGDVAVQIQWFYSATGNPPPGWTFIDVGDPLLPASVVTALLAQYVQEPGGTYAYYFAAYFSGF